MTAAAPLVRGLVEAVERAGVPREVYLAAAGIREERLADETNRFELAELDCFYNLALDLTADEALGLHMAEHASEAAFDLIAPLLTHAPTLRDCFLLATRFGPMVFSDGVGTLTEKVDKARLTVRVAPMSARGFRVQTDLSMAGMVRLLRLFVSARAPVDAVYFEHPPPGSRAEYVRLFGGRVRFGESVTAIEFPRAWLDKRTLHRNDRLFAILLGEARRHAESLGKDSSYGDRIERYVLSFPPSRIPSMASAARALGTTVRTLRRYLTSEGTSYRAFVERALERAARDVLKNPQRSVREAAEHVGYSHAAAFARAFKRWTGLSPAEFRRTAGE